MARAEEQHGNETPPPILVLGVGNVLMQDDGIGVRAVEVLRSRVLPESVQLVDGGTAGLDLVPLFAGRSRILVIDAMQGQAPPGTVWEIRGGELCETPPDSPGGHASGLVEALRVAQLGGLDLDTVTVYAVQPFALDWSIGLSWEMTQVLPRLADLVYDAILPDSTDR